VSAALRVLQSVGRSGMGGLGWCAHGLFDGL
jgi:hypothetical protein